MKKAAFLTALMFSSLVAAVCYAAPQQSTTPSLAELARQLRAQREKASTKPAKVYTNEDMPKTTSLSDGSASSESAEGGTTSTAEGSGAASTEDKTKSGVHDEKYYHERMAELQAQKEMHQRELSVLEQKLSENQTQYYSDPNKTLQQESNPGTFRSDINKKADEIEKKKKQIEADDKAIEDLQQQCQREGCPPGWLR